ncbi:MAG: MYXO-CTERM sorting domain-containing protein [Sandaracinaceae bacterium]|nr:MYXO-CTERM sorting domain-containing protein [Sandaracinaceae bacterium]
MALGLVMALGGMAATAQAQGTITDGTDSMVYTPVSTFDATDGPTTQLTVGGALQTYQVWFFVRGAGLAAERPLPAPDTATYVGAVATLGWTNFLGTGLRGTLVYTLASSGPGTAQLGAELTVTNPGATSIAIELFAYVDVDAAGTNLNDSAALVDGFIDVTDATTTIRISGLGSVPDAYQVGPYPTFLRSLQDATPTNLDGSGLPFGPGDFALAVQWGVAVPAAGSLTRGLVLSVAGPAPPSVCGNGIVETGETCDDGFADACGTCNVDCTGGGSGASCGDGVVCPELEACDDGFTDACGSCNVDCMAAGTGSTCGDGSLCMETEACDDGFTDACGTCNADCTAAGTASTCGDGDRCEETEACDDGFTDACGTCNADCTAAGAAATCGDGVVCAETETCDDGFTDACGACNADCTAAGAGSTCGDGDLCDETEACDDGNTSDGDGCSMACEVEVAMDAGVPDAGPTDTDAGTTMDTDAGTVMDTDAGTMMGVDAATTMDPDGGVVIGTDAGGGGTSDGGCSCRAGSSGSPAGGAFAGLIVLGLVLARRRRRA